MIRFAGPLSIAYLVGGLASMLLIRSTVDGGLYFSVKVLAVPLAALVLLFVRRNRSATESPWFLAVVVYCLLLLFSWPYVMAFNASHVSGRLVYEGRVVEKFRNGRGGGQGNVRVLDRHTGELVGIPVSDEAFAKIDVGADFQACFLKSLFGIPFLWTRAPVPQECRDVAS
jgi:hypothetical protein